MVNGDSADVWSHQDEFGQEGSVGVPPDAFSRTGQDWGLPPYLWDVLRERDFDWLRRAPGGWRSFLPDTALIMSSASIGRMSARAGGTGPGVFTPADEPSQIALGESVLSVFRSTGVEIVAEDLGTVPDFVRESLARAAIPGYKVFRWERHWHSPGQPFAILASIPVTRWRRRGPMTPSR